MGSGPGGEITRADVETAVLSPAARRRVTPYARRLARELGIDPGSVTPRDGEVVRAADVRAADGESGSRAAVATRPRPRPRARRQRPTRRPGRGPCGRPSPG
ncbi:E3 binding domain-containing protein [Nocardioides sp.]|uniref:E3 binding domain-containing protein n=1 Tax=Nocardioides sp. TaxID=35761 RepID=UPI0035278D9C